LARGVTEISSSAAVGQVVVGYAGASSRDVVPPLAKAVRAAEPGIELKLKSLMFPAWVGLLFFVAGLLGYNAGLPPYGIPVGLVMAILGWWIIRTGAPSALNRPAA
jgi:hypothetical protein